MGNRTTNAPTSLEQTPPVPVLYAQHASTSATNSGSPTEPMPSSEATTAAMHPLHAFLGFEPARTLLSLSARDPTDTREMPPNGPAQVCVQSLRGVRRLTPSEWTAYVRVCRPDVVLALSDTPFTDAGGGGYSQKRLTKSVERSAKWLAELLKPGNVSIPGPPAKKGKVQELPSPPSVDAPPTPPVFVHLVGLSSHGARKAFADTLLEPLEGASVGALTPLKTLDERVAGYVVDLAPLRVALDVEKVKNSSPTTVASDSPAGTVGEEESLPALLRTSLARLPVAKPRLVTGAQSPHEILRLIASVGADLFDGSFAQRAADIGVALDFTFPVPQMVRVAGEKKREVGHNIYSPAYQLDFARMADALPSCPCACCSPIDPPARIYHGYDTPDVSGEAERTSPDASRSGVHSRVREPYTRAYIHHLLHTHEMSAHALLAMHNLAVLDCFLAGVREVLLAEEAETDAAVDAPKASRFADEIDIFEATYDSRLVVLEEATDQWREVDLARGKGRLAREKGKEEAGAV